MSIEPFILSTQTQTMSLSVTNVASASVALPNKGRTLRVVNEGPNTAFVAVGAAAQTAVVPAVSPGNKSSIPVLGGSDVSFSISDEAVQQISAICAGTGTATLRLSVGEGA